MLQTLQFQSYHQIVLRKALVPSTQAPNQTALGDSVFDWINRAFLVAEMVKNLPAMQESWGWSLGWEDPLEKGMAFHFSILAWRIPRTEEPGGLQSMEPQGPQTVEHDWASGTSPFSSYTRCSVNISDNKPQFQSRALSLYAVFVSYFHCNFVLFSCHVVLWYLFGFYNTAHSSKSQNTTLKGKFNKNSSFVSDYNPPPYLSKEKIFIIF